VAGARTGTLEGWELLAPSAIPFPEHAVPTELDEAGIRRIVEAFAAAARRAVEAGYDVIEIHGAHGYLIHEFRSALSNQRTDSYGGSVENRQRFPLEVVRAVREAIGPDTLLDIRLSASDWAGGGVTGEETAAFSRELVKAGVDVLHISSGGNVPAEIPVGPGYQLPLAEQVKQEVKTLKIDTAVVTEVKKVVSDLEGNMKSLYSLQTQAFGNGRRAISGIAVGADSKTAEGHIMMMADKVMFVDPNSNQIVPAMVVEVKNGRSTLGLNGDLIADGTIQGRHIAASQSIRSPKLEGGSINIGDGRFTVDSNGVVNISSSNGNVGLKIRNDFIGLWDDNQSLVVAIGFLG